jgi:hypothetical protein
MFGLSVRAGGGGGDVPRGLFLETRLRLTDFQYNNDKMAAIEET